RLRRFRDGNEEAAFIVALVIAHGRAREALRRHHPDAADLVRRAEREVDVVIGFAGSGGAEDAADHGGAVAAGVVPGDGAARLVVDRLAHGDAERPLHGAFAGPGGGARAVDDVTEVLAVV